MLKPNENWTWSFDDSNQNLILNTGLHSSVAVKLAKRLLVNCAFEQNEFSVDDALCYQTILDQASELNISENSLVELAVNGVAAFRFHKPVQPKSWFFSPQGQGIVPEQGEIVQLSNDFNQGLFIVLDANESTSLCICIDEDGFQLDETKTLAFAESIKVMNDRLAPYDIMPMTYTLVG